MPLKAKGSIFSKPASSGKSTEFMLRIPSGLAKDSAFPFGEIVKRIDVNVRIDGDRLIIEKYKTK